MCIKHLGLLTKCVACSEPYERSSLSNPVEARYRVTPKKCMSKEDVVAYVLTKHLLCSLDVPDARSFLFLFGSGQKKRSCDSMLA